MVATPSIPKFTPEFNPEFKPYEYPIEFGLRKKRPNRCMNSRGSTRIKSDRRYKKSGR